MLQRARHIIVHVKAVSFISVSLFHTRIKVFNLYNQYLNWYFILVKFLATMSIPHWVQRLSGVLIEKLKIQYVVLFIQNITPRKTYSCTRKDNLF